ncbi:MAG: hypothetical protein IJ518_04690 [Clostridia bacterium]|nr:hypothetical protein [Clostridia bacterium]
MEHCIEFVMELLFGFAKETPDKMPDDITYEPNFIVKHPTKKKVATIVATLIMIIVFSLLWIFFKHDISGTGVLFAILTVLGFVLLVVLLISFSFSCVVTENSLNSSYGGLFKKKLQWGNVHCIRVVEKTDEKSVIIAIYDESGKCIIDLNTDMNNAWHVVKMAEEKNITIHNEKDLSIKQIAHL